LKRDSIMFMKRMLKQLCLAIALIFGSVASPLGVVDVQALESSCRFTYVGEYGAPNDSTVTMARGNAQFTCPQAFRVEVFWDWSTTSDMSSIFLSDGVATGPTGNADIVALNREPDTTYYLRVGLVEVRTVREGNINTFPEYPRVTSGVVAVKTKAGPDLSQRPPPSGWTYPRPVAPTLFSQTNSSNNNGVCLVIDGPAFPGYDQIYMGALQFELRHGGLTGSAATTGYDAAGGRINFGCNNGYNIEYTASLLFSTMSADGSNWIRNVASSLTFTTMWNPAFPTTTTTVPPTTTTTTTSVAPASSNQKSKVASTTTSSGKGSNPITTQPKSISATTAVDAVEDDGQSDDDFADIGVSLRSGKFDMRISSSFPETKMMLRAFKKGSKSIIWNMTTNADGNYRILTTRALKGFTLSLWIDGDKWDSLVVR
jgi:hypothetical protein